MKTSSFIVTLISIFFLVACDKKEQGSISPQPAIAPPVQTLKTPPETELRNFWDLHLEKPIKALISETHRFQEINARYRILREQIVRRYGKIYNVNQSTIFCTASPNVLAGASYERGTPHVTIFVPALYTLYPTLSQRYGAEVNEIFEMTVVTGFLHELDHLANGTIGFETNTNISLDKLVESETLTWSQTCEFTIEPLLKRGIKLDESDTTYYTMWALAGRSAESPKWRKFIEEAYSVTRR